MNAALFWLVPAAYLLGSIPTAYLVAKRASGVDLRRYGSGNVGGSNLLKLTSKRTAAPVFAADILKGALPVLVASLLGLSFFEQVVVGLAAVIGHNWTVFLHFNGGRGVATTLGVVLVLVPKLTLVLLTIALIGGAAGHMGLATIIVIALFPVAAALSFLPVIGWLFGREMDGAARLWAVIGMVLIFLVVAVRRLTAPRTDFSEKVSRKELFFNRLFLDRDIRDKKAWLGKKTGGGAESGVRL